MMAIMSSEQIRQLLNTCEDGNLTVIQNILESGSFDVDTADDDDVTLLQVAAANGHEHLVRLLLMRGAALDKPNSFGWTPLLLAARHGHINVVALLLQNRADINARTKLGANAMTLGARGGHLQTCKLLVESGIDLSPTSGVGGTICEISALLAGAHHGHDTVVRYLLDRSFDVNQRTPSTGINALMLAALNGHMTTSQILIERGADPNLTNVNNHTPLEVATVRGKREVKGYLDRKTTNKPKTAPEDVKPDIIEAAKQGDLRRINEILNLDLTQRDACSAQDGATPLMFAAMAGRMDIAQILVEKGCDINEQDTVSGWTALMQATYHGKKTVAKYLVNAGADVLIPAKNGCTAFDMASLIEDVDTELYRLLAAKAVQISRPDKKSKTWSGKQNGSATSPVPGTSTTSVEPTPEEQPKTGLKAWWNRMSNRFRNLKLGRSFTMNNNKLAPLPADTPTTNDETLKGNTSPKTAPSAPKKSVSTGTPKKSVSADPLGGTSISQISTIASYDTILLETKKSASIYTLGLNQPHSTIQDGTLKAVIPPFLPPPTFETDRPKMPPVSTRRSISSLGSTPGGSTSNLTLTRPLASPMKLLQSYSTQNLATPPSPSTSTKMVHNDSASPSSSTGASQLSNKSRGPSSASSSTLTAGSDTFNRSGHLDHSSHGDSLFTPVSRVPNIRPPNFNAPHSGFPSRSSVVKTQNSSMSSSSASSSAAVNTRRYSQGKSSSRDSASTLTPSPSPTPKGIQPTQSSGLPSMSSSKRPNSITEEDELGGILKNLSLEQYNPIFEEQEVDMEAFLTLSDTDLKELGISHVEPRRQILAAITELNSGKGRERQHFQETMTNFESTLRSRTLSTSNGMELGDWGLNGDDQGQGEPSAKSRSS